MKKDIKKVLGNLMLIMPIIILMVVVIWFFCKDLAITFFIIGFLILSIVALIKWGDIAFNLMNE